ncbi:MAG: hypothetical protein DMG73_19505 [Acidobacteria bacterium]|nr:MAG: hypothetical protein DMG73_19505 [Acidobacteriota bacterium]
MKLTNYGKQIVFISEAITRPSRPTTSISARFLAKQTQDGQDGQRLAILTTFPHGALAGGSLLASQASAQPRESQAFMTRAE